MTRRQKVFILCPAGSTSGGPEALHQFAGALCSRGVDAALVYYPNSVAVPGSYQRYGAAVSWAADDDEAAIIVIPEVATSLAWRFPRARKAIWWLSVDNYFKWRHINPGASILTSRPDLVHLCQSHYARDFLARRGAGPLLMLTDFVTPDVFARGPAAGRIPVIAYNPKKAPEITRRLMARPGQRVWLPLEGLDKASLADLLRQVRVYVDFGPHPGRDRIPREAALSGAVILTGRKGAAAFDGDLPIPGHFRLDEQAADFESRAVALLDGLLRSDAAFLEAWHQQAPYRDWIDGNRDAFMAEVDRFIEAMELRPSRTGASSLNAGISAAAPPRSVPASAAHP